MRRIRVLVFLFVALFSLTACTAYTARQTSFKEAVVYAYKGDIEVFFKEVCFHYDKTDCDARFNLSTNIKNVTIKIDESLRGTALTLPGQEIGMFERPFLYTTTVERVEIYVQTEKEKTEWLDRLSKTEKVLRESIKEENQLKKVYPW